MVKFIKRVIVIVGLFWLYKVIMRWNLNSTKKVEKKIGDETE